MLRSLGKISYQFLSLGGNIFPDISNCYLVKNNKIASIFSTTRGEEK